MSQQPNTEALARMYVRLAGFLCTVASIGLLLIRGLNALGRLPWSYIGSFVRDALVMPAVCLIGGVLLIVFSKKIATWIAR